MRSGDGGLGKTGSNSTRGCQDWASDQGFRKRTDSPETSDCDCQDAKEDLCKRSIGSKARWVLDRLMSEKKDNSRPTFRKWHVVKILPQKIRRQTTARAATRGINGHTSDVTSLCLVV